jgi:hypothetical protein
VYLVLGPASGTLDLSAADAKFVGENEEDWAGCSLAMGDVDGDGGVDVLIGAIFVDDAGDEDAGMVYLEIGPASGTHHLSSADGMLVGESGYDHAGSAVATGDVDGDGVEDVLIGARNFDTVEGYTGAAYLVFGPVSGRLKLTAADATFAGMIDSDAGYSVATGDVDGNGIEDVLVGADGSSSWSDYAGAVFLLHDGM